MTKAKTSSTSTGSSESTVLWVIILISILYKYSIGISGYSGQGVAPMFGDFEAQRHWLEITFHLPSEKWYFYDLQYWGLDYPPLTAYHSKVLGAIASFINPSFVALDTSRGFESDALKIFMRLSALITDSLVLLPAILYFAYSIARKPVQNQIIMLSLICPGFALIDHGHFQYNSAMLGLSLAAFTCFLNARYALGSFLFVCSLMFKQMALYYALPVFFYLLGICFHQPTKSQGLYLLVKLGVSVLSTFALCLAPFLNSTEQLSQIVHRVFPVARGIYEDKVGNVWFALSIFVKIRNLLSLQRLVQLSLFTTVLSILPSCLYIFKSPKVSSTQFLYTLSISSLGFFLFSFQVHEKHILLPLMPITLLYPDMPFLSAFFNQAALFSMWPLLKKDQLAIPYVACSLLWHTATRHSWTGSGRLKWPVIGSYVVMISLHLAETIIEAPAKWPELYIVLNSLFSAALFGVFFLVLHLQLFPQILQSAAKSTKRSSKVKKE